MQLYARRFLVLAAFSCFSFCQSIGWFTYAGFAQAAERFYDVDDAMIGYYLLLGPLLFIASTPFFIYVLDKRGLRISVVIAMVCVLYGAILRTMALFTGPQVGWVLAMCGQVGTSIAGVCAMAAPPKISSIWFGPNERAASTAVGVVANSMGSTAGFLLGLVCAQPGYDRPFECVSFQVYLQLGFAVVGMVMVLLFVHDEPPTPSSFATARDVSLIALLPSLGTLLRNANFVLLVIVAGCSQGLFATWAGLLDLLLKQYGPSKSAWLGFGANASGIVGGLVLGVVSSKVALRYKHFIIALYLAAGGVFVVFNLMLLDVIPQSLSGLGVAISVGSFLMGAGNVFFYELAVEIAFPAPEGLVGCIVTVLNNGFGALMYPLQGNLTSNVIMWINAGNSVIFGLIMFFLRENYNRHTKDVLGELSEGALSENKKLIQPIQ